MARMSTTGFSLFDTPIGRCGIGWNASGIATLALPEAKVTATRARLRERHPEAKETTPPKDVALAIERILALLRGEASDLAAIAVDLSGLPPFHRRVYEMARTIPPGTTLSYGQVATRLGSPGSARAVGQALGRNPLAIVVPCHRVLAANGKIGGFTANGGLDTKRKLLAIEALAVRRAPAVDDGHGFDFDPDVALAHLSAVDPELARIIDVVGPFAMRRNRTQSVFDALAEAIVYQQLTGRAAATIFGRVKALFEGTKAGFCAAAVARTEHERLRSAGLSRAKALALSDLAERTLAGELPSLDDLEDMDDEAVIAALTKVRGVGRWTVEMLLMFRLGRADVLPVEDYGVRKGFGVMTGATELPTKKALVEHGARWAPYRSVASWYMWRAVEL